MTDFSPLNFPLPERTGAEGLDARVTALEETIVRLLEARRTERRRRHITKTLC